MHLLDAEGQLVVQHDSPPGQGERPTWCWRDAEIIQDEHPLVVSGSLPEGVYVISVGMYDWLTGDRLPVVNAAGERLPNDSIPLENDRITLP